jgi:hypothetical protein
MSTDIDIQLDQLLTARENLVVRHAQGLLRLLDDRDDLRGVYALADQMGDGVLWCA